MSAYFGVSIVGLRLVSVTSARSLIKTRFNFDIEILDHFTNDSEPSLATNLGDVSECSIAQLSKGTFVHTIFSVFDKGQVDS